MNILNFFFTVLGIGACFYLIFFLFNYLIKKIFKTISDQDIISPRTRLFKIKEFLFLIITFGMMFIINGLLNTSFTQVFLISLFISYGFIFKPYYFASKSENRLLVLEQNLWNQTGFRIKIIASTLSFSNALSYGALPFSNVIVISHDIIEKMEETELEAVALHEIAHIKKNHLLYLYFYNIGMAIIYNKSIQYILTLKMENSRSNLVLILIVSALMGLLWYFIIAPIMKKFEIAADQFAAKYVGGKIYVKMLLKLDTITSNGLSNNDFYHPPLAQRIQATQNL